MSERLVVTDFVARMDLAYAMADLVISRAGASSISELCLLGKPAILVPSPNVAEDHQTHNAMALVNKNAAVLSELSKNVSLLAQRDSANRIADEVVKLIKTK